MLLLKFDNQPNENSYKVTSPEKVMRAGQIKNKVASGMTISSILGQ